MDEARPARPAVGDRVRAAPPEACAQPAPSPLRERAGEGAGVTHLRPSAPGSRSSRSPAAPTSLRVHCAAQGWPIVGDAIYGDAPRFGGPGLQLHAREIAVPLSKKDRRFGARHRAGAGADAGAPRRLRVVG